MVGVGQRADRLLRQVAPAELADQPDLPARDLAREQRLDPVRPLPRVHGDERLVAGDADLLQQHLVREPARVRALDRAPQQRNRLPGLRRVACEVVGREPDAPLGGHDPRMPAHLALELERVEVEQLARRTTILELVDVGEQRRGDLAHEPRSRRRIDAQRGRADGDDLRGVGQRHVEAVAGRPQRSRVHARVAERPPPGGVVQRQRAAERQRPFLALVRAQQLLELELGQELRDQLAVRALPDRAGRRRADVRLRRDHAARDSAAGSGAPKDWNTLRSRTA